MRFSKTQAIVLLITILLLGWIIKSPSSIDTHQGFIITPAIQNLGNIESSNQLVSVKFKLLNGTPSDVTIGEVHTSCGCTAVDLAKGINLHSGEERSFEVKFLVGERTGDIRSKIFIEGLTNSGVSQEATSTILAHGITAAYYEPKSLVMGTRDYGSNPICKTIHIRKGEDSTPWDNLEFISNTVKVSNVRENGSSYDFDVCVGSEDKIIGANSEQLTVYLLDHGKRINNVKIVIPVTWEIDLAGVSIYPSMIYLGLISPSSTQEGVIRIVSSSGERIKGLQTSSTSKFISASFNPSSQKNLVECKYKVLSGSAKGSITAIIDTLINLHGDVFQVKIPIVGFVQ